MRIADAQFIVRGPAKVELKGLLEVWWDTTAAGFGTVASWDSICYKVMDIRKAGLACAQMGFSGDYYGGGYLWQTSRHNKQEARFEGLTCPASATKLSDCDVNDCHFSNCCAAGQDTGISCSIGLPIGAYNEWEQLVMTCMQLGDGFNLFSATAFSLRLALECK